MSPNVQGFVPSETAVDTVELLAFEITSGISGTYDTVNTYDTSRTMYLWQYYSESNTDDFSDMGLSFHWVDSNTIGWQRGLSVTDDIQVKIQFVEFATSAGVTTYEVGPISSVGAQAIGGTVDMSETFIIYGGCTATGGYSNTQMYPRIYLSSTTQVTWANWASDSWSNSYCQVVEVTGATVQRGYSEFSSSTTLTVDIGDPIVIANTMMLAQIGEDAVTNIDADEFSMKYEMSTTDDILFTRDDSTRDANVQWEVVEWPSDVTVAHYTANKGAPNKYVDVTITEVDTSRAFVIHANSKGGAPQSSVGVLNYGDDTWYGSASTATFTSSTVVRASEIFSSVGAASGYIQVIEFPEPNNAPTNDATPACINLDDSTYLYARYRTYIFTSNVSDADGYADIDYVDLMLFQPSPLATLWKIRYDEDTNVFSEIDGTSNIELITGSSSYVKSGNDLDITWHLKIEWAHSDELNTRLRQWVYDAAAGSDDDTYSVDYDTETRLDYSAVPTMDDKTGTAYRGRIDQTNVFGEGTLKYYGTTLIPASSEVDVWMSCPDVASSPWSDTTLTSGAFAISGVADDVVGEDTYTFKPVAEGAGSGGASLYYTTDLTDTYIADEIVMRAIWNDDPQNRTGIGDTITLYMQIQYEYDDANVTYADGWYYLSYEYDSGTYA
ncbi:MAG: hypothetical protein ACYSW3_29150, partial [Planctomycetota bacterium]